MQRTPPRHLAPPPRTRPGPREHLLVESILALLAIGLTTVILIRSLLNQPAHSARPPPHHPPPPRSRRPRPRPGPWPPPRPRPAAARRPSRTRATCSPTPGSRPASPAGRPLAGPGGGGSRV